MQHLYAWLRRHPTVVDAAWAALIALGDLLVLAVGAADESATDDAPLMLLLITALATCMTLRRRYPQGTLVAGGAVAFVQLAAGSGVIFSDVVLISLVYTAAAYGKPWASRAALVAAGLAGPLAVLAFYRDPAYPADSFVQGLFMTAPFVICWLLGRLTRIRRAYYAELEDRARRLERERDARAKVAVAAERARIARELHDVVAHNVSVMIVQADGAAYVIDQNPAQAKEALTAIAATGRQALDEMRRLLGVLRSAEPAPGEYVPQPGVEQLPELLDQTRRAGLPVRFTVEGVPQALSRGLELTVYRIVQEALTNARKHGGPGTQADVRLCFELHSLAVVVEDSGRGAAAGLYAEGVSDSQGHGLIGMRERVGMVGGTLDAGPRRGGGFRVAAVLPLRAGAPVG